MMRRFFTTFNVFLFCSLVCAGGVLVLLQARADTEVTLPVVEFVDGHTVTPTDVYYLAVAVDEALVTLHNLHTEFTKPRISDTIRPPDVFERVVLLAEEFNTVHRGVLGQTAIDPEVLVAFKDVPLYAEPQPKHVYSVLNLMRTALEDRGVFVEYDGIRSPKQPSDVFQVLREISAHHVEILDRGIAIPWNQPKRVYETNLFEMYTILKYYADREGVTVPDFTFPEEPEPNIQPRHVYQVQLELYEGLTALIVRDNPEYQPVIFHSVEELGTIEPGDVFDLTRIILSELKRFVGEAPPPSSELVDKYLNWEFGRNAVVPGDVYKLVSFNSTIVEALLTHAR
ncbi:hypothetical protein KC727_00915 [Candidatus Kaiserbacteria bacterium]|nr:hypothetical protein [Candidatus Kaiserbacteria bacterium]